MKKKILSATALLITLLTTSCGYGLKEVYDGIPYNSPIYKENYYKVWDERSIEGGNKSQITSTSTRALDIEKDKVFDSYDSEVFKRVEPDSRTLDYYDDFPSHDVNKIGVGFGPTKRLSLLDNSFRYGVTSKLFDGQLFCHAKYELVRVQIDENGFGVIFDKETPELDYFAINLKGSIDHTNGIYTDLTHTQNITLKVSFYCKNDLGYDKKTFTHDLNVIANRSDAYTFFGFDVNPNEVSRVQGISIEYVQNSDNLNKNYQGEDLTAVRALDKALLLYEIFLPNTTWR
jgi:hypothetical protein